MLKITKKSTVQNAYIAYQNTAATCLDDVYGRYSWEKANAFRYCLDLMEKYDGYGMRIISANTFRFSAGFIGYHEDERIGKKRLAFFYITASYDYMMYLD